ncbi:MAG: hypothetical protein LBH81_01805 [Rickettsiales bacterium]|jgi:hypothetical protein|nr:hypothetical protein [Rickettsiales bacterium]
MRNFFIFSLFSLDVRKNNNLWDFLLGILEKQTPVLAILLIKTIRFGKFGLPSPVKMINIYRNRGQIL